MAKRFTDTTKWKKHFIRALPPSYKLLWFFILDDCDHAGIWQVDFEIANFRIGNSIDSEKAKDLFKGKFISFDNDEKWFIPSFIEFQYSVLKDNNRAHISVIKQLMKYKLFNFLEKEIYGATLGASVRAKDKDKDKEKEKDKDIDKENNDNIIYIVDYLNQKTDKKFKATSAKTRELIIARINDGFTLDDFKRVIDNKVIDWLNEPNWNKFLRPETLFSNKFESYLNQNSKVKESVEYSLDDLEVEKNE